MFNMLGEDPPVVMLSINRLQDGQLKDTAANILSLREFVVHMTDEPLAAQMHACGQAFPSSVSELDAVGLHAAVPGLRQRAAVAAAKRAFESFSRTSKAEQIGRAHV